MEREDSPVWEQYRSRTAGVVSPAVHGASVVAVGCGAGSYMLEKLARAASPRGMSLVDFDVVDWPNLSRTNFTAGDVGRPKAEALAARIEAANPFVAAVPVTSDFCALGDAERKALCAGADLLIGGTDHFPAQALVNRCSQEYGVPAVFIGIHAGAQGGRVVWSVPGETPCYRCVARERYTAFAVGGNGALDLPGAHGALPDVQFIDMVALKICLALLDRGNDSAAARFFSGMAGRTEVIVRCSPEYGYGAALWDAVLADLPTEPKPYAREITETVLFAMDTLWLTAERDPECPDCRRTAAA